MINVFLVTTQTDIEECYRIREEVFIREQGVPVELERDLHDKTALHFLARINGLSAGTARVLLKDNGSTAKIGRVAVMPHLRGQNIGSVMMRDIEDMPELKQVKRLTLEAQTHALSFYVRLGYEAYGDEFLDAGIRHRHMKKEKPCASTL